MISGTLMQRTIVLLRERKESLPELAEATGLPFYWLRKMVAQEIRDPSVNRVQKLYEHLTGKPLITE